MRRWLWALLLGAAVGAAAEERVTICYNYGCLAQAEIVFGERQLAEVAALLQGAGNAKEERELLARAVGKLYGWAGEQSPVRNDRGGNYPDDGVDGRMDCIDHSTSTTRLLQMLDRRGWINWHRVLDPMRRTRVVLFQHFSAVIEEVAAPRRPVAARKLPPVPDYVPLLLAFCDCQDVVGDIKVEAGPVAAGVAVGKRFVIDSWFVDNGKPAVVLPLADWLDGEGPSVE